MSMFKMNIVEIKLFGFDHISQPIKVLSMKVNPYLAHKNKPKDSKRKKKKHKENQMEETGKLKRGNHYSRTSHHDILWASNILCMLLHESKFFLNLYASYINISTWKLINKLIDIYINFRDATYASHTSKHQFIGEWIKKMCIHTHMKYYSTIKKKEILPFWQQG